MIEKLNCAECAESFEAPTLRDAWNDLREHIISNHPATMEACTSAAENGEPCPHAPSECPECTASALAAGIPLSVVLGRTKLTDHFSKSYIESQARPRSQREAAWEDAVDKEGEWEG